MSQIKLGDKLIWDSVDDTGTHKYVATVTHIQGRIWFNFGEKTLILEEDMLDMMLKLNMARLERIDKPGDIFEEADGDRWVMADVLGNLVYVKISGKGIGSWTKQSGNWRRV